MELMLIFLLFISNVQNSICMIVIPIESLNEDNYMIENDNSHVNTIKKYLFKDLYTLLEIGTPMQKIFLFIRINNQDFYLISKTSFENKKEEDLFNYKYNLSNLYKVFDLFNEKNSISYIKQDCKETLGISDDFELICNSNDSFLFFQEINMTHKIIYDKFFFKLIIDTDSNIPGEIGLGLFDKYRNQENNFLKILKSNDLINNYNWYFDFDSYSSSKGKLIIGSLPHENYPDKFSENDLIFINIDINSYTLRNWRIEFDKIYFNDLDLSFKKVEFIFDSEIIIGTNELELKLNEYFFNNLIFYKKCFSDIIKLPFYYYGLKFFYCNTNLQRTLFEYFPSLNFFLNVLNYTFEITNEELFIIKEKYIYLKILFPVSIKQNNFILGRIFTLKYPLVFNPD